MFRSTTMEEKPHDIFTILGQEPEQTDVILKFGLASPVAIILWHVIGSFFLPIAGRGAGDSGADLPLRRCNRLPFGTDDPQR